MIFYARTVVVVKRVVKFSNVRKMGVACTYKCPPKQLESRLVGVEELCPIIIIDVIDVNGTEGKADIDDNEDEEENKNIDDHVSHRYDDWPCLTPHQPSLKSKTQYKNQWIEKFI